MGRPGLTRHRKFARLTRLLGSAALARGHLELIWEVAYENGDDLLGDAGDVELLAQWQGEAGVLATALAESGFVDLEANEYRIHDLYDHAPEYVRKRADREAARQEKGITIREIRAAAARARWAKRDSKRDASGQQTDASDFRLECKRDASGTPPSPAPAPLKEDTSTSSPSSASPLGSSQDPLKSGNIPKRSNGVPQEKEHTGSSPDMALVLWPWNALAARRGLPQSRGKGKVAQTIRTRLRAAGWLEDFTAALKFIDGSPFHRGENDRGWRADLTWLLKIGKVEELAEKAAVIPAPASGQEFGEPDENGIRNPIARGA